MFTERLTLYLAERAVLEKRTGVDTYAQPLFADPVLIKARVESANKMVRNALGQEVVSDMTVFCTEEVAVGDRVSGRDVLAVFEMTGRNGKRIGCEAAL